jgi:hypothetical protein
VVSRVVSLYGIRNMGGGRVAGEVAWLAGAILAVARADVQTAGEWTAEIHSGLAAASGGVAAAGVSNARERGAALSRRDRWERWESRVSFHTVTRRDADGERLRRRIDVRAVFTSSSRRRLDLSARYDLDAETDLPSGPLAERARHDRSSRGRVRARLDVPVGSSLAFRYQVQALPERGALTGFVAGLEVRHETHRTALTASVTDFALPGGSGYVSRPGIAGYESVSAVQRRGSDVSARAALRLGYGATVTVYAGVPWEREPRYLLSFQWRM